MAPEARATGLRQIAHGKGWRRPVARRGAWVLASQSLSSLTTFAVTILVARSVDAGVFGTFTLGLMAYLVVLSLARALVMQPLAIRQSTRPDGGEEWLGAAAAAALAIGAVSGAALACYGVLSGGADGRLFLVFAVCMPGTMLQDLWRFAFFAMAEPRKAAANDLVWLVVQLIGSSIVLSDGATAAQLTAAWGGAGCVAAVVGIAQARCWPGGGGAAFVRRHRDLGGTFIAEFLIIRGWQYAAAVLVMPIVGVAAVGGLRGVATIFGPYTTMAFGLGTAALSEGSRLLSRHPARFVASQRVLGLGMAAMAGLWGLVLATMPSAWGRALLGATWQQAASLVAPVAIGQMAIGSATGCLIGLRVLAAGGTIVRLRLVTAIATLALGVLGAFGGIVAAAWGIAGGNLLLAVGAWRRLGQADLPGHPSARDVVPGDLAGAVDPSGTVTP